MAGELLQYDVSGFLVSPPPEHFISLNFSVYFMTFSS
jgi:hypothetical protein